MPTPSRLAVCSLLVMACSSPADPELAPELASEASPTPPPLAAGLESVAGSWRFELDSPGGALPFFVSINEKGASLVDHAERLEFSSAEFDGETLRLEREHYDSTLEGKVIRAPDGQLSFDGQWRRRSPGKNAYTVMVARAEQREQAPRFVEGPSEEFAGRWRLTFTEKDGATFAGVAEFEPERPRRGPAAVVGTIKTESGDYRYLQGGFYGQELKLSVFDGAHAFLIRATRKDDGSLTGDFWSRDTYHVTFVGETIAEGADASLRDAFGLTQLTSPDQRFRFDFPKLGGGRLRHDDPTLKGKPLVVEIFGSWCPNCNDQAPLMSQWYDEYHPKGLEMVGIAFEFTGEENSDMQMLERYRETYEVAYPLILGGTQDKKEAAAQMPDLSAVVAYPTTLFVDAEGRVQSVYTGFSGPATGEEHEALKAEFRERMDALVAGGIANSSDQGQ